MVTAALRPEPTTPVVGVGTGLDAAALAVPDAVATALVAALEGAAAVVGAADADVTATAATVPGAAALVAAADVLLVGAVTAAVPPQAARTPTPTAVIPDKQASSSRRPILGAEVRTTVISLRSLSPPPAHLPKAPATWREYSVGRDGRRRSCAATPQRFLHWSAALLPTRRYGRWCRRLLPARIRRRAMDPRRRELRPGEQPKHDTAAPPPSLSRRWVLCRLVDAVVPPSPPPLPAVPAVGRHDLSAATSSRSW